MWSLKAGFPDIKLPRKNVFCGVLFFRNVGSGQGFPLNEDLSSSSDKLMLLEIADL